jgi:hypothetical protein
VAADVVSGFALFWAHPTEGQIAKTPINIESPVTAICCAIKNIIVGVPITRHYLNR